jgi:hypothetical protein
MCVAFSICIFGLIGGIVYDLFDVFAHHHSLEFVLGNSIEFYMSLGAIGMFGFALFLALLVSAVSSKHKGANPK